LEFVDEHFSHGRCDLKKVIQYVDANQGYSPHAARWVIQRMEKYGLAWIEEPCPVWNHKERLKLAQSISVPILGDESCSTLQDVAREIELGAVGMVSIKVARTGFYESRKIIHLCEQAGIPYLIGSRTCCLKPPHPDQVQRSRPRSRFRVETPASMPAQHLVDPGALCHLDHRKPSLRGKDGILDFTPLGSSI
jgi:hypothetical protein